MGCCDNKDDKAQAKGKMRQAAAQDTPQNKILVIGASSVGKTAIIHQYIQGGFKLEGTPVTTGVANQYKTVTLPDGSKMKLDIWDTAGADEYS